VDRVGPFTRVGTSSKLHIEIGEKMIKKYLLFVPILYCLILANNSWAYNGICETAEDVQELPAGHWCAVANSNLRSVEKKPQEYDDFNGSSSSKYSSYQRAQGVKAIINSWDGAVLDTKRDQLIIFGGGHNDYGGNELYSFDLRTLRWTRLTDPKVFPNRVDQDYKNSDGTPISRHTYGGLAYIAHLDKLFAFGGAGDHASGSCGVRGTWTFDLAERAITGSFSTNMWQHTQKSNEPQSWCEDQSFYDEQTGLVFYSSNRGGQWSSYDAGTGTWTQRGSDSTSIGRRLIIPGNRRFAVKFGGNSHHPGVNGYEKYNLANNLSRSLINTTGDKAMEQAEGPGAAYDDNADRIVAWKGGTTVYSLDVDSNVWTRVPAASSNLADPGNVTASGGVFGRFQYSKNLNIIVTVDSVDSNVYLYRFTAGDGIPQDTLPPAIPTNVTVQ